MKDLNKFNGSIAAKETRDKKQLPYTNPYRGSSWCSDCHYNIGTRRYGPRCRLGNSTFAAYCCYKKLDTSRPL